MRTMTFRRAMDVVMEQLRSGRRRGRRDVHLLRRLCRAVSLVDALTTVALEEAGAFEAADEDGDPLGVAASGDACPSCGLELGEEVPRELDF